MTEGSYLCNTDGDFARPQPVLLHFFPSTQACATWPAFLGLTFIASPFSILLGWVLVDSSDYKVPSQVFWALVEFERLLWAPLPKG